MSFKKLFLILLYIITINVFADNRNVLLAVPDPLYNGSVLYSFCIGTDHSIYGNAKVVQGTINQTSYNITNISTNITNPIIPSKANQIFISVDIDYHITSSDDINILLATSSKTCNNTINCDWKVTLYNIDGDAFDILDKREVAGFKYPDITNAKSLDNNINITNEIMVNILKYGEKVGVTFNGIPDLVSSEYAAKMNVTHDFEYDVVLMAKYDLNNLTFLGYNRSECVTTKDIDGNIIGVICGDKHYDEYELLSFHNQYISTYNPSIYPIATAIYFENVLESSYFIECATNYVNASHGIGQSIGCRGYRDNDEYIWGQPHIGGTIPKWYEYNSTLIAIDDAILSKNNYPWIRSDIAWIPYAGTDNNGKVVIVNENGKGIEGRLYVIFIREDGKIQITNDIHFGEIPYYNTSKGNIMVNTSYNAVVTAAPINQDMSINDDIQYFVIAWAVEGNGIYAAIYDINGERTDYSKHQDIIIYESKDEIFTWLDIQCINNAVFITFTVSKTSTTPKVIEKIIYITDYIYPDTMTPTQQPSMPSISPTDIPTTTTTKKPTLNIFAPTLSPTPSPTVMITTSLPTEEECDKLKFVLLIQVNTTKIELEEIKSNITQNVFYFAVIEELKNREEIINSYRFKMNDIDSEFYFIKTVAHYLYDLDILFCVNSDNNDIFNKLEKILNDTIFWRIDVENNLNNINKTKWNDRNSKIRLKRLYSINNNNTLQTEFGNVLLIIIIMGSIVLMICIGLIIFRFINKKKQIIKLSEAELTLNQQEKDRLTSLSGGITSISIAKQHGHSNYNKAPSPINQPIDGPFGISTRFVDDEVIEDINKIDHVTGGNKDNGRNHGPFGISTRFHDDEIIEDINKIDLVTRGNKDDVDAIQVSQVTDDLDANLNDHDADYDKENRVNGETDCGYVE